MKSPSPRSITALVLVALLIANAFVVLGRGAADSAEGRLARSSNDESLLSHVDPMIGTVAPGFTNPGPAVPHGMVHPGPDTEGPFNYGGYFVHNSVITGFSQTHMSAGVPQAGYAPLMPVVGPVDTRELAQRFGWTNPVPAYASPFDHATEVAEPGYYAVTLERYGTRVELSATERAAIHRYTIPSGEDAKIVLDVSRNLRGYDPASLTLHGDGTITSTVTSNVRGEFAVHTAMRLDTDFDVRLFNGSTLAPGQTVQADRLGAILDVAPGDGPVVLKLGFSYTDEASAVGNLEAEIPGWNLEDVRREAEDAWRGALSRIQVEAGTPADKERFYTALYHAQLFPNLYSDADGRYQWDGDEVRRSEHPRYSQFSLWDSYNGQNQLLALTDPARYANMTRSLLDLAEHTGSLPQWQLAGHDAGYMSGDPAIPFLAEAYCQGIADRLSPEHRQALYREAVELALDRPQSYVEEGYLPVPRPASEAERAEGGPSETGTTLEYGLAEFALALVADRTGRPADEAWLSQRALNYRNVVDPDTGFVRPRHADGSWLDPWRPELNYGFQEGTAWQYSWLAMQDLAGLVEAMGGSQAAEDKLDVLFSFPATASLPVLPGKAQTHATAFGTTYYGNQYVPGNEHDLEAPFVYNYVGEPWKTQAAARGAASTFTATPDGLPGNDDLGALSGWLVWTMLGLYPITPGAPVYTVASPVFEKATIQTPAGNLTIRAPDASSSAKYVQQAHLGSQPLARSWFTGDEWRKAGNLTLEMGPTPNRDWAAEPGQAPPSLSTGGIEAFGCRTG